MSTRARHEPWFRRTQAELDARLKAEEDRLFKEKAATCCHFLVAIDYRGAYCNECKTRLEWAVARQRWMVMADAEVVKRLCAA